MRKIGFGCLSWAALGVLTALSVVGCTEDGPSLVMEVDGVEGARVLDVKLKRYYEDGRVEMFDLEPMAIREGTTTLNLLVRLPEAGRWAAHLVASGPDGRPASETRCHDVDGVVVDQEVHLSVLSPEVDADGDTFPDDYRLYCAERTAAGLPCRNTTCESVEFTALLDCNPPEDPEIAQGCPEMVPTAARFNPFAPDRCADCFDQDCFGGDINCEDRDSDGYRSDRDCNDEDASINPGVEEGCQRDDVHDCPGCGDMLDNDCDGVAEEGCYGDDYDSDGVAAAEDCNDCDPGIGAGLPEVCDDGVDNDCSSPGDPAAGDQACDAEDQDGDGHAAIPSGDDCDDTDPRIHPEAPDRCDDGVIQNCVADRNCTDDNDGDSFDASVDCRDDDPTVNPWGEEVCDAEGVDEDCDGQINEVNDPMGQLGCGRHPSTGRWRAIDFDSDVEHCGGCRYRCEGTSWREGDRCQAGVCRCGSDEGCEGSFSDWCCVSAEEGGGCVDLRSDQNNCGVCGHRCRPGETCEPSELGAPGRCNCQWAPDGSACPTGPCWSCCPSVGCVNTCSDLHHCGDCGTDCASGARPLGDVCIEGQCLCGEVAEVCQGEEICTDISSSEGCGCADLQGDPNNCGSCGVACNPSEICVDGDCRCPGLDHACGSDETCCPEAGCLDLTSDPEHCGGCGIRCDPGEDCQNGECVCTEECEDGDPCTTGFCQFGRCAQRTTDADGDGYCDEDCPDAATGSANDCIRGDGDCDDSDESINPGANEDCDTGGDDDCNGETNELNAANCEPFYRDNDNDGFGTGTSRCYCEPFGEYTAPEPGDCNELDPEVNPGADELCNDFDDDCDIRTNDGATECPGRCCGSPASCQECCISGDCSSHGTCDFDAYACVCDTGWSDCADSCDCNIGAGQICCDGECTFGECCDVTDCSGSSTACLSNECECEAGYEDCSATCDCNVGAGYYCCGGTCQTVPC